MTETKVVTIDLLARQLQTIERTGLDSGSLVDVVKLRKDLGLLFPFFSGVKPPADDDGTVANAIQGILCLIVTMQDEIQSIRIIGSIPDSIQLPESLSIHFDKLVGQMRLVGYFAFPHSIGYIEKLLVKT